MPQLSVTQIFKYCPRQINLTGFPDSMILRELEGTLGREVSYNHYCPQQYGKRIPRLVPSFPPQHTKARQRFFKNLPDSRITKSFFDVIFPKTHWAGRSNEEFVEFCETVYRTTQRAREELTGFGHLPEAQAVLRRLDRFDGDLERSLRALSEISAVNTFAVDKQTGMIVPIDKMPGKARDPCYRPKNRGGGIYELGKVQVKMRGAVLKAIKQATEGFRRRIINFVRTELESPNDNIRENFERLAAPIRLHYKYSRLVEKCREGETRSDWLPDDNIMPPLITPSFGQDYNVQNLFPLSLTETGGHEEYVPINFGTKGERKVLIVGLHSGGKSFILKNLTLLSIIAQAGENVPANPGLTLPLYERISYYINPNNGRNNSGKLDTEVEDVTAISNQAQEGDLQVFDELLDSADPGAATWLTPVILRKLMRNPGTVLASTHRGVDCAALEKDGWTIMSPEHLIRDGKVVPAQKLKRGWPDEGINRRYVSEKYGKLLED